MDYEGYFFYVLEFSIYFFHIHYFAPFLVFKSYNQLLQSITHTKSVVQM